MVPEGREGREGREGGGRGNNDLTNFKKRRKSVQEHFTWLDENILFCTFPDYTFVLKHSVVA